MNNTTRCLISLITGIFIDQSHHINASEDNLFLVPHASSQKPSSKLAIAVQLPYEGDGGVWTHSIFDSCGGIRTLKSHWKRDSEGDSNLWSVSISSPDAHWIRKDTEEGDSYADGTPLILRFNQDNDLISFDGLERAPSMFIKWKSEEDYSLIGLEFDGDSFPKLKTDEPSHLYKTQCNANHFALSLSLTDGVPATVK